MVELDYLVIGHATRDLVNGGFTIGGTVSYATRTAQALGCRAGVVTSAGPDLDLSYALDGVLIARFPAAATTTFENLYTPAAGVAQSGRDTDARYGAAGLAGDNRPSGAGGPRVRPVAG